MGGISTMTYARPELSSEILYHINNTTPPGIVTRILILELIDIFSSEEIKAHSFGLYSGSRTEHQQRVFLFLKL